MVGLPPLRLPRPWSEDVVYMVLVDRFHRGKGGKGPEPEPPFHGGNLAGVLEKLDYLEDLGVTALWLSPLYKNQRDGYHGYWPVDFFAMDPRFGTFEELRELVSECHRRGMKVLLDKVLNHAGYEHPMARDKRYRSWFHHSKGMRWMDQKSLERGSLHGLPDFAQEKPEVARFLIDMSLWWLEKSGVDGFRLDAVKHVPSLFWKRFSEELHSKAGPGFLLLGEVFRGVPGYIARYQAEHGIDSVFDVPFADAVRSLLCRDAEHPGVGLWGRLAELKREYRTMLFNEVLRKFEAGGRSDLRALSRLASSDSAYLRPLSLATFIDNHDLSRFASEAEDPAQRLRMALGLLAGWRGMPVLTYGTEAGMSGRTGDGSNRASMPFGTDPALHAYARSLLRLRRSSPALLRGTQQEVHSGREVYAFLREAEGDRVLVALNNSRRSRSHSFAIPAWAGWSGTWTDALSGERREAKDGRLSLTLPPRSTTLMRFGQGDPHG